MPTDPIYYILATGLLCAPLGFICCAVLSGSRVRRANLEGWKEAVRFYQLRLADEDFPASGRGAGESTRGGRQDQRGAGGGDCLNIEH